MAVTPPVLVVSDFDGSLAELVEDPAAVVPVPGAVEVLERLAGLDGVAVAVVSGRPVDFLAAHLPAAVDLHGLYGLEQRVGGRTDRAGSAAARSVVAVAAARARHDLPAEVDVEDKGGSLTLHWRRCPLHEELVMRWAGSVADDTTSTPALEWRRAKASVELHPAGTGDKGTVVDAIAADVTGVVVLGDDVGDVAMFDAADRHGAGSPSAWSWRVAVGGVSAETPPSLSQRADLVVDSPAAAVAWLTEVAQRL